MCLKNDFWLVLPLLLIMSGCDQREKSSDPPEARAAVDSHTSRNSLDWAGTYSGILPCASCPGIETVVTLNADGDYRRTLYYLDEGSALEVSTGSFSWDAAGGGVILAAEGEEGQRYQVGENVLFHLDQDGSRITGDLAGRYRLEKHINDAAIEDRRWKLVELRGRSIETAQLATTPVLMLSALDSAVTGNASCNTFSGAYAIRSGNRIRFGRHMAVTMMACPDMSIETEFLEVLTMADNYAIGDAGTLTLNRARMAPLARFEQVDGAD